MMWGNFYGPGGGLMAIGMGIFNLAIAVLFIVLIVYLIRAALGRGTMHSSMSRWHGESQDNAMNILKERYAKGEINKEEFEQKMKDIKDAENK